MVAGAKLEGNLAVRHQGQETPPNGTGLPDTQQGPLGVGQEEQAVVPQGRDRVKG